MGTFPEYIILKCGGEDLCFRHAVVAALAGKDIDMSLTDDYFRFRVCDRCTAEKNT